MKQGTLTSRIVMFAILAAIGIYLGVYAWRAFTDPFSTVLSYSYTVDDALEATGFLVRSESVIPGTGDILDLTRVEGEKVAAGAAVAVAYRSTAAASRRQEIHALELELEQLNYSLTGSDSVQTSAKLSQNIIEAIVTLRGAVASGDLTRLEDQTMELKSLVYKRDYTYGDSTESVEAIGKSIQTVSDQLTTLRSQAQQDTSRITVDKPGTFSAQVDGYEDILTPALIEEITPSQLDAIAAQKVTGDSSAVGKLITDARWYFVCSLSEKEARRFVEGRSITARFSRDWSGEVTMEVERVGTPENGRVPLVFSTDRFLSDTTLLRRQTVDLVFSSVAGIRVPKQSIRVVSLEEEVEKTVEGSDETIKEKIQREATGVFVQVGGAAEFKEVEVLEQRDDYCIVLPVDPKDPKKILRAGDQIIIAAESLVDGQVIHS